MTGPRLTQGGLTLTTPDGGDRAGLAGLKICMPVLPCLVKEAKLAGDGAPELGQLGLNGCHPDT